MTFRPVVGAAWAAERLMHIFPRASYDTSISSPAAGAAVAAMIYIDAVVPEDESDPTAWARPSTITWCSDQVLAMDTPEQRTAWTEAASQNRRAVQALLNGWGLAFEPRYADNTREGIRDDAFSWWLSYGALRRRPGVPTSSSRGRWALAASFADLFDPALTDEDFERAADEWRTNNLEMGALLRLQRAQELAAQPHAVTVSLPGGQERTLEPGLASLLIKGVIEDWATNRLGDPVVIAISEPGAKVYSGDQETMQRLGIHLDVRGVLPDILLVDVAMRPAAFWIIEVVASDGPVDEQRKGALLEWADGQNIPTEQCRFLTVFPDRNHPIARKRLTDLAQETYAWYYNEPGMELAWYAIDR